MSEPLSAVQKLEIRAVLAGLDLGQSGLLTALDATTGERLTRRGVVQPRHRACARAEPTHRTRGLVWSCARHGLFGRVAVAGRRIGILSLSAVRHPADDVAAFEAAAHRIEQILRGRDSSPGLVGVSGGGGPSAAGAFAPADPERLMFWQASNR